MMICNLPGADVTPGQPRATQSGGFGAFAAVVPLPRRWARAKNWAERSRVSRLDGNALHRMRQLELQNRG